MTTSFQSQTKTKQRTTMKYLMGGGLLVIVIGIVTHSNVFTYYTHILGLGDYVQNVTLSLVQDREELRDENQQLRALLNEQNTATALASLNQNSYIQLANTVQQVPNEVVFAEVLSKPPYSPYDQYILNKGEYHGIAQGQLVVAQGQYIVGHITRVSSLYSLVELFSAPDSVVHVSIEGVLYKATGQGGGVLHTQLPRSYRDSTNISVKLPGGGPYLLGEINETEFDPQDSFVQGVIQLPVNIYTQELVAVVENRFTSAQDLDNMFDNERE